MNKMQKEKNTQSWESHKLTNPNQSKFTSNYWWLSSCIPLQKPFNQWIKGVKDISENVLINLNTYTHTKLLINLCVTAEGELRDSASICVIVSDQGVYLSRSCRLRIAIVRQGKKTKTKRIDRRRAEQSRI